MKQKRVTIITGHYGSGKTEFAVNLALDMAPRYPHVALSDLDIVNPYFRSRERETLFLEHGVELICSSQSCHHADVPSIPAEVLGLFQRKDVHCVIDVGGDEAGARVLSRFKPQLDVIDYDMWFVLNANRPQTATVESALRYIAAIEQSSRVKTTGIVNNTHLCGDTDLEQLRKGAALAHEVCQATGLPLICHVVEKSFVPLLQDLAGEIFPIDILMTKPWEIF